MSRNRDTGEDRVKRATAGKIRILKGDSKRKVETARHQVSDDAGRVEVAGRVNAVVVRNSDDRAGAAQGASSRRRVHIHQANGDPAQPD